MIETGVKAQELLDQIHAIERQIQTKIVRGERVSDLFEQRRELLDKYNSIGDEE